MLSTNNSFKVMRQVKIFTLLSCIWLICSCSAKNAASAIPDTSPEIGSANTVKPTTELNENVAPTIQNTSYACDPIIDSVVYKVGDTDTFTLLVEDEFPDDLEYQVEVSQPDVADVSVNEQGTFTIKTVRNGEAYLWFSVSDHDGLVDEFELHIIVE